MVKLTILRKKIFLLDLLGGFRPLFIFIIVILFSLYIIILHYIILILPPLTILLNKLSFLLFYIKFTLKKFSLDRP